MSLKRAVLKAFDGGTYTATVQVPGSLSNWLSGIPVSRAIASGELLAGRNVAILIFDEANPGDAVVAAVWT